MKITKLKSTIVAVPTQAAATSEEVRASNYRLAVLVEVFTDEGLVGLGEAPNPVGAETTKTIIDSAEPLLVGEDATDVEKLKKKLYALQPHPSPYPRRLLGSQRNRHGIMGYCRQIVPETIIPDMGWRLQEKN